MLRKCLVSAALVAVVVGGTATTASAAGNPGTGGGGNPGVGSGGNPGTGGGGNPGTGPAPGASPGGVYPSLAACRTAGKNGVTQGRWKAWQCLSLGKGQAGQYELWVR